MSAFGGDMAACVHGHRKELKFLSFIYLEWNPSSVCHDLGKVGHSCFTCQSCISAWGQYCSPRRANIESVGENAHIVSVQLFPLGFSIDLDYRDLIKTQENSVRDWDSPY